MLLITEGVLIGFLVGLTGAGGGILAVPALMTSQGWSVAQAAPVGLLAISLSALIGAVEGLFRRIVRYRAALWIALTGIPMAHVGVMLSERLPTRLMTIAFGLVMVWVAVRLFIQRGTVNDHPPCRINPQTGQLIWTMQTTLYLTGIGMLSGLLTGLLGVGGGFVIVPALKKNTNIDIHSIVATSLMVIFLIGSFSIGAHLLTHMAFPWSVALIFVIACMAGMVLGRKAIKRIPPHLVQRLFAALVLAVAGYMILSTLQT